MHYYGEYCSWAARAGGFVHGCIRKETSCEFHVRSPESLRLWACKKRYGDFLFVQGLQGSTRPMHLVRPHFCFSWVVLLVCIVCLLLCFAALCIVCCCLGFVSVDWHCFVLSCLAFVLFRFGLRCVVLFCIASFCSVSVLASHPH